MLVILTILGKGVLILYFNSGGSPCSKYSRPCLVYFRWGTIALIVLYLEAGVCAFSGTDQHVPLVALISECLQDADQLQDVAVPVSVSGF
ncbi:hypothetical protein L6452_00139 [Arctium lappa]|uniref:Uncharacterized protein n=1 Tax=Arctium lappa TaxID=4217 RepID=A0ACB9FCH8_ARCLA|nr:hypothetical protein L6452_00139 [Arctium lappa]